MTTFVNLSYTTSHPGVVRFERAYASVGNVIQRLQHESTYAAALLMFGALSLVGSIYDIVDASQEGQELGAWVVLWTAVLVGLVGLANTANVSSSLGSKPTAKPACGTAL
jgi:hypothetical protein